MSTSFKLFFAAIVTVSLLTACDKTPPAELTSSTTDSSISTDDQHDNTSAEKSDRTSRQEEIPETSSLQKEKGSCKKRGQSPLNKKRGQSPLNYVK